MITAAVPVAVRFDDRRLVAGIDTSAVDSCPQTEIFAGYPAHAGGGFSIATVLDGASE